MALKINKRPKDDTDDVKADSLNDDLGFKYESGFILQDHNIEVKNDMTVQDAKLYALKLPGCVGFTFQGENKPTTKTTIWFKNEKTIIGKNDKPWNTYWAPV